METINSGKRELKKLSVALQDRQHDSRFFIFKPKKLPTGDLHGFEYIELTLDKTNSA
jgi:hypothetical protein